MDFQWGRAEYTYALNEGFVGDQRGPLGGRVKLGDSLKVILLQDVDAGARLILSLAKVFQPILDKAVQRDIREMVLLTHSFWRDRGALEVMEWRVEGAILARYRRAEEDRSGSYGRLWKEIQKKFDLAVKERKVREVARYVTGRLAEAAVCRVEAGWGCDVLGLGEGGVKEEEVPWEHFNRKVGVLLDKIEENHRLTFARDIPGLMDVLSLEPPLQLVRRVVCESKTDLRNLLANHGCPLRAPWENYTTPQVRTFLIFDSMLYRLKDVLYFVNVFHPDTPWEERALLPLRSQITTVVGGGAMSRPR